MWWSTGEWANCANWKFEVCKLEVNTVRLTNSVFQLGEPAFVLGFYMFAFSFLIVTLKLRPPHLKNPRNLADIKQMLSPSLNLQKHCWLIITKLRQNWFRDIYMSRGTWAITNLDIRMDTYGQQSNLGNWGIFVKIWEYVPRKKLLSQISKSNCTSMKFSGYIPMLFRLWWFNHTNQKHNWASAIQRER